MNGAKEFAAPSYKSLEISQNLNTDGAAMSTSSSSSGLNNSIQLYSEPVENIKNIVVTKARAYGSTDISSSYEMKSKNRGYLFFVNISEFKDNSKFRKGAAIDKANMITMFREMDFKIQYHENISLKEFHRLIDQLVMSNELRSVECFCKYRDFFYQHRDVINRWRFVPLSRWTYLLKVVYICHEYMQH